MICVVAKLKCLNVSYHEKPKTNKNTFWERMMANMNYKPGWYLSYFFYCMIPMSIYVWYLLSRRKDDFVTEVVSRTSLRSLPLLKFLLLKF